MNVLISGDGVAGPTLAFWLLKLGADVTIVERSPTPRSTGQAIDIRGPAVKVIRQMGIEGAIRVNTTTETGLEKIDSSGKVCAVFDATGDPSRQSVVSEYEILRSDLSRILRDTIKDSVRYIYGESISALEQTNDMVHVEFANGTTAADYDLVVGADGITSRTRALMTGEDLEEHLNDFDSYTCFFTIPRNTDDSETRGCLYNATGRRTIILRPRPDDRIAAYLSVISTKDPRYEEVLSQDVQAQKMLFAKMFQDAGWQAPRVLAGLHVSDDFYMQKLAQVKLDNFTNGRVALLGDAGYAPSSGYGTSIAIYGAYVLAGEISKQPKDIAAALSNYQRTLQPYVKKVQKLPPGVPWILNPETQLGVNVLNYLATAVYWTNLPSLIPAIVSPKGEDESLPEYNWPAT